MFWLNWFRPRPEFDPEQIVRVDDDFSQERFMLIRRRRWARPSHAEKKCWVYDGPIFSVVDNQHVFVAYGYHFREGALASILEYGIGNLFGA